MYTYMMCVWGSVCVMICVCGMFVCVICMCMCVWCVNMGTCMICIHTGDAGLIPGSGRSPGGRHGNPLQYSCLENPMDRGACRTTVHRVAKSMHTCKRDYTVFVWLISLSIMPQIFFTLLQIAGFPSFLQLNNMPLCICTTSWPVQPLLDS